MRRRLDKSFVLCINLDIESFKMTTNIKNQHYVWRHYLKPWSKEKKIWCIRDTNPFKINVEKIAKEDYFYAADPLNNDEILRSYLKNYPLTWKNIDVDIIFVNEKEELFSVPYFSHIGKSGIAVVYDFYNPETKEATVFLGETMEETYNACNVLQSLYS